MTIRRMPVRIEKNHDAGNNSFVIVGPDSLEDYDHIIQVLLTKFDAKLINTFYGPYALVTVLLLNGFDLSFVHDGQYWITFSSKATAKDDLIENFARELEAFLNKQSGDII